MDADDLDALAERSRNRGSGEPIDFDDDDDGGTYEPLYRYRVDTSDSSDDSLHNITFRTHGKKKKPILVPKSVTVEEPNPLEMTLMVVEYLIIEGHIDTAKSLCTEANIDLGDKEWKEVEARVAIKRDILEGKIGSAIEKLNEFAPGLIDNQTDVRFNLYLQNFIEFIRIDDIDGAFDWSENKLSKEVLDEDQMLRFEHACTLAAYTDTNDCKYRDLMDQPHREMIADCVNSAVLKSLGKSDTSRMENLMKMKMFMTMNTPDCVERGTTGELIQAERLYEQL